MVIVDVLYVCSIICLFIYIHSEKRRSYKKGFSDGVEHYSDTVNETLRYINQWNKEAEEAGIPLTAYIESLKPLNKEESEVDVDDT